MRVDIIPNPTLIPVSSATSLGNMSGKVAIVVDCVEANCESWCVTGRVEKYKILIFGSQTR